ncbi:MAG: BatD family protein, partial [Deltaproteobacteria bacterium]
IKDLPTAGRPPSFTGLVGVYSIATQASPTDVNVGDPITLTILVTGPPYLDNVELPPLQQLSALQADFKIPAEMAEGQVQGKSKVFTQTIRAKRADVNRIPPVEISYFNTETGNYETARSEPIPLNVKQTRIITARDAEGGTMPVTGSELNAQKKGIAQNYEDSDALQPQTPIDGCWTLTHAWLMMLFLPPLFFVLCLLGFLVQRQRQKDPAGLQARKALPLFLKEMRQLPAVPNDTAYLKLDSALRRYLGCRLQLPSAAITYADVEACLAGKEVPEAVCHALRGLFDVCEAARYGGAAKARQEDWQQLCEQATRTARQFDEVKL